MRKHPPPHLRPGGSAALPAGLEQCGGDWASSPQEGRPREWRWRFRWRWWRRWRRRQEEPRHARVLSTPPPRPQTPEASMQHGETPGGREPPLRSPGPPAAPRGSRGQRVAQLGKGGAPGASRRSQPAPGPSWGEEEAKGAGRVGHRPGDAPNHRSPSRRRLRARPRGSSDGLRPGAGRGGVSSAPTAAAAAAAVSGSRSPGPRAGRCRPPFEPPRPPSLLAPAGHLLRTGASQLRSALPLRATGARPPLK